MATMATVQGAVPSQAALSDEAADDVKLLTRTETNHRRLTRWRFCAASGWAVSTALACVLVSLRPHSSHGSSSRGSSCLSDVSSRVDSILGDLTGTHVSWGVHIVSEQLGELVDRSANRTFVPASNNKLLATSAALTVLGPQHRIETTAMVSDGSLCITPAGDPSLDDGALALLAAKVRHALPTASNLTLKLAISPWSPIPDTWEFGDLSEYYGAQPGAAILNENVVHLWATPAPTVGAPVSISFDDARDETSVIIHNEAVTAAAAAVTDDAGGGGAVPATTAPMLSYGYEVNPRSLEVVLRLTGSMALSDAPRRLTVATRSPALLLAAHLANATAAAGLTATPAQFVDVCDSPRSGAVTSVSVHSAQLVELVNHTLLVSDNLYAEAFLRSMGGASASAGLAAVRQALLSTVGMRNADGWVYTDGSGLSRHNLVAPAMLTSLLRAMAASELPSLLPVAGRTGTLAHRMVGTIAEGRVFAKTGTMSGVSSLSGYLRHPDRQRVGDVYFSLIANNSPLGSSTLRAAQDAIVVAVAEASAC